MTYWKYSFWWGIFSFSMLLVILALSPFYSIIIWKNSGADMGILFPLLLASWFSSLFSVAFNNFFLDGFGLEQGPQMPRLKKYTPSFLSIPGFISFIWFCITWFKGSHI